jgi:hypothetical protein
MSEKEKKQAKAAEVSKPTEVVANRILAELDRVHVRTARY